MSDPQGCQLCPRLVAYRKQQQTSHPEYCNQPVPAFGAESARLLIVGLAPGLHGANATGRPFTGDDSGKLLFSVLHDCGLASAERSVSPDDGMRLRACRITNAVKCVPPGNQPAGGEIATCNKYLHAEILAMPEGSILLALGGIAHRAIVRALGLKQAQYRFAHSAEFVLPDGIRLIDSYHPSRYNQNTGRLTGAMLARIFERIESILHE